MASACRNRLKACALAEIEPRFERLNGQDPTGFIVSVNLDRRHLKKGQQAMLLAMAYPEAAKLRRKGSGLLETKEQFSQARLSQARAVLHFSEALAIEVVNDITPLHRDAALITSRRWWFPKPAPR